MSHTTRQQRLARAYAAHASLPYQQALQLVRQAAARGLLPPTLDAAHIDAFRTLDHLGPTKESHVSECSPLSAREPHAATTVDLDRDFVVQRYRPNQLHQTPDGTLVKISSFYDRHLTATVEIPNPGRTTVRSFTYAEAVMWAEPSRRLMQAYNDKYGME